MTEPARLEISRDDRIALNPSKGDGGMDRPYRLPLEKINPFIFGGIVLGIALALWGLWILTAPEGDGLGDDLPRIQAAAGPIKMRAPGAADSANPSLSQEDRVIYQKLDNADAAPTRGVEHLLSEPEEPHLRPPSLPADFVGEMVADDGAALPLDMPTDDGGIEPSLDNPGTLSDGPPAIKGKQTDHPRTAPPSLPGEGKGQQWMAHLGSFPDRQGAVREKERLIRRMGGALKADGFQIVPAKNSKGFLLKAGPFIKGTASDVCQKVQGARGSCFLRRSPPTP